MATCSACGGRRSIPRQCSRCGGGGRIHFTGDEQVCSGCHGTGLVDEACSRCSGTGQEPYRA